MQWANWVRHATGIAVIIFGAAASAQGQTVRFVDIKDAVPGRFFEAATTAADGVNGNRLVIGFNGGLDLRTFKYTDFRASTAAYSHITAMDTIRFRVVAPRGYAISKVTYKQRGSGSVIRTARASGAVNLVVDEFPADAGVFSTNPTLTRSVSLLGLNRTAVAVSITTSLFAFSTPTLGSASVAVNGAEVLVELLPTVQ